MGYSQNSEKIAKDFLSKLLLCLKVAPPLYMSGDEVPFLVTPAIHYVLVFTKNAYCKSIPYNFT